MIRLMFLGLMGMAVLAIPNQAPAGLILDFNGGFAATPSTDQTLGWQFSLAQSETLTALGIWDLGSNGLAANHLVAIWSTSGGASLAQVLITNASTPVASTQAAGRWLFENLATTITLTPGNYVLGADYPSGNADLVHTGASSLSLASGVTFTSGRFTSPTTPAFDFPNATFPTSGGHFGPNAMFGTVAAVPEPGSLTLVGLGAFGLIANAIRRRRQQAA